MERDLFGSLLLLSVKRSVDIEKVLAYPLTPIPLSLCHIEGDIRKTEKLALIKALKNEAKQEPIEHPDVVVHDGFLLLSSMKDVPLTMANIAKKFLQMVTNTEASIVVLVFHKIASVSIHEHEMDLRDSSKDDKYTIKGCDQKRSSNFSADLKNENFREEFVKFLVDYWGKDELQPYITAKVVYVDYLKCYKFESVDGLMVKTEEVELSSNPSKDTTCKIVYHVVNVPANHAVLVKCSDGDILAVLLGNFPHFQENVRVCLQAISGRAETFIDINSLYDALGPVVSAAVPAFHAFTGCSNNPAFYGKGKPRPLKLMRKSKRYLDAFTSLSELTDSSSEVFETIEEYVCEMYGFPKIKQVNDARVAAFDKAYNYKQKNTELTTSNLKNFDASCLPVCRPELREHILRSAFIVKIWSNAYSRFSLDLDATEYGWKIDEENKVVFKWFDGCQLPQSISDITFTPDGRPVDNGKKCFVLTRIHHFSHTDF